jgi:CCR4-NOT transcription complex subunit 7/8
MVRRIHVREVWAHNLDFEFQLIRSIVQEYPYVALDTELPGVGLCPVDMELYDYNYQKMKANVDNMKLIQMGLTFSDAAGNLPTFGTFLSWVWQFNFCEFDPEEDLYVPESIQLLCKTGMDFQRNRLFGIDSRHFCQLLWSTNMLFNPRTRWITFHGAYDFGYLLKLLLAENLPTSQAQFFHHLHTIFPNLYDVKYLINFCPNLHSNLGLSKLANTLKVERLVGEAHQAGSDSLLTSCTYHKIKEDYFSAFPHHFGAGVVYGLGPAPLGQTHF